MHVHRAETRCTRHRRGIPDADRDSTDARRNGDTSPTRDVTECKFLERSPSGEGVIRNGAWPPQGLYLSLFGGRATMVRYRCGASPVFPVRCGRRPKDEGLTPYDDYDDYDDG